MDQHRASPFPFVVLVACGGAACVGDPTYSQGQSEHAVMGGQIDSSDTAVVAVLADFPDGSGLLCSGTLVSPHVVLTAAHCVVEEGTYGVYTRTELPTTGYLDLSPASEVHANPIFDESNFANARDIGVVVLRDALTGIDPIKMNRSDLTDDMLGGSVRLVGYGRVGYDEMDSSGIRRSVDTTLTHVGPYVLNVGDATHGICKGDSGGPALMTIHGRDVIIGVASFFLFFSQKTAYEMRVDTQVAFVDEYIRDIDPGWAPEPDDGGDPSPDDGSTGCSAAGGPAGAPGAILLLLLLRWRSRRTCPGRPAAL